MKIIINIIILLVVSGLWSCRQSDEETMAAYKQAKERMSNRLSDWTQEKIVSMPFREYDRQLQTEEDSLFSLLKGLNSDSLKEKEMRTLKLTMDSQRFMYAWSLRNIKGESMDADPNFVNYARSLDLNDPELTRDNQGIMVCDMRLRWEKSIAPTTWSSRYQDQLNVIQKYITNQEVRNKMATIQVESYLNSGGNEQVKEVFALYREICNDQAAIERLTPRYEELTVLSAGFPAPDFEMTDTQGKRTKLSGLRGQFVVIDVWATWCGPCKSEIPYFEKQHELFASDPRICFISITMDDNLEAWKEMLAKDKPGWKQFVVEKGMKSDFAARYFISSIPRFMLIDPQGKIISVDVVRPSEKEFTEYVRYHTQG